MSRATDGRLGKIDDAAPVTLSISHGWGSVDPVFTAGAGTGEQRTIAAALQAALDAASPAPQLDNQPMGPGSTALLVRTTIHGAERAFFMYPRSWSIMCVDSGKAFRVPESTFIEASRPASEFVNHRMAEEQGVG